MKPYFEKMPTFGSPLSERQLETSRESAAEIAVVEAALEAEVQRVKDSGLPAEKINARGQMTIWQRLEYLVDAGSWNPLHTIFNPADNKYGTTGVVDGIGKIGGKWAVIIGFDNKVLAGAWVAGQSENILRVTDMAKRLNIPLIWLVNCSGVDLPNQELVYPDRRGSGATFFRHAELQQRGVPIVAAIYGTNPAGGGYQAVSPTVLYAHKDANMAVGGGGIVSGMSPKGAFDEAGCESLIEATRKFKSVAPGRVEIHHDATGFFRHVGQTEQETLDGVKEYMEKLPAYDPSFFRVAEPKEPLFQPTELNNIVPYNQKRTYNITNVLSRLVDGSECMEFRPGYGPEIYCGLVKVDGFLCGVIGNQQGFMPPGYPEYADYPGIGGKLYRQGLIKMNEFVTMCGRDRLPIMWFQDTTGIDVGDIAEKAELLGLGQSLIYSIEQTDVPQMLVVLRKASAAAHYVMGGPQGNNHNTFALGTPTTEVYVMHGETAAAASFARRLVKEKDAGKPIGPVIDKMNDLVQTYYDKSRPVFCAKNGFVDEIVPMPKLRNYMKAFAGAAYQNPKSICAHHQMVLPRLIKG
jgi:glutaconyl-CoA decarboxylase